MILYDTGHWIEFRNGYYYQPDPDPPSTPFLVNLQFKHMSDAPRLYGIAINEAEFMMVNIIVRTKSYCK